MQIAHLYISAGHNYFGHHGKPSSDHPTIEVSTIECVAGHGIRGDRFYDYQDSYKGQLTLFSSEVYDELVHFLQLRDRSPGATRRNVITRGIDLNKLIGTNFEVQGVQLEGVQECRPCYWMDEAFAPGAEKFLKGRGGLRAKILSDGTIRVTQPALVS